MLMTLNVHNSLDLVIWPLQVSLLFLTVNDSVSFGVVGDSGMKSLLGAVKCCQFW